MLPAKTIHSSARPFLIIIIMTLVFNKLWNHSVILGDSYVLYAPHKFLIAQALKSWRIYSWYPWQQLGMPFVADITAGWFYPPNLIYLLFPFSFAHSFFIFVHYPLAAIFMDMFLRRRGLDRYSSLSGGLVFSLSGYLINQHKNAIFLIGPAWAPLAVYFMDKALGCSMWWAFGAAVVLAVQVLAGEPQSAVITAIIVGLMAVITAWKTSRRRAALGSLITCCVFPIFLCAIQWMPTFEVMWQTTRAKGLALSYNTMFSFHPGQIIELVWPAPFGRIWPNSFYWAQFALKSALGGLPWSLSYYIGFTVLVLAVIGVIFSNRPWKIWVGAGVVLFLFLAFGSYTPVYPFFYHVFPVFKIFRYPAKYMAWFTGFTAVAASLGLENVQFRLDKSSRSLTVAAIIYMAVVVVFILGSAFIWPLVIRLVTGLDPTKRSYQLIKIYLQHTGLQFLLVNLAFGLILLLASRRKLPKRIAMPVFLSILILDYYLANVTTIPVGPPDIYGLKSVASQYISEKNAPTLGQYRIYKEGSESPMMNAGYQKLTMPYAVYLAIWQRNCLVPDLQVFEGFEEVAGYTPIAFIDDARVFEIMGPGITPELYNVNYIISPYFGYQPRELIKTERIAVDEQNDLVINRVVNAWPRAYLVSSAKAVADLDGALAMLDETDFKKSVIIITNDNINILDRGDREIKQAAITGYMPDHVVIETNEDAPSWLVLSDRYYPGWNAYVDGVPGKIYKANMLVRAIHLQPGRHKVDFLYRSVPFRIGTMFSVVSWIMLAAISIIRFGKKRAEITQ